MKAKITLSGVGRGEILLDGHDVSSEVRGFTIRGDTKGLPALQLDFVERKQIEFEGEVVPVLTDWQRELLVRMGWTPPAIENVERLLTQPSVRTCSCQVVDVTTAAEWSLGVQRTMPGLSDPGRPIHRPTPGLDTGTSA